jgi:V/A-type H+-transporting ATPase subunit I
MKSPMLKAELLIRSSKKSKLTEELQKIGLVHLEELGESQSLANHQEWKQWLDLQAWLDKLPEVAEAISVAPLSGALIPQLQEFREDWGACRHREAEYEESSQFWNHWGNFNPEHWQALKQIDLHLGLFKGDRRDWEAQAGKAFKIKEEGSLVYFCRIGRKQDFKELNLDSEPLPPIPFKELEETAHQLKAEKNRLFSLLKGFRENIDKLQQEAAGIQENWEFQQSLELWQDFKETPVTTIKAWLPSRLEDRFKSACSQLPIAYRISSPSKNDKVPVELKNGKYSSLFEPITKIFQLPHYFEFDLTPLIAVFYPILFAYCLGDAGYGAIMTLAALVGWFSFLKKQRGLAALVGILGISTTVMGLIKSGSLFGVALSLKSDTAWIAALGELVIIPDDSDYFFNAFNVALLIGVFQILIGIGLAIAKAWYYDGFKESLSLWGKLFIVISAVALFMSDTLLLTEFHRQFLIASLIGGMLLIMFFHDLSQSLLVRLGSSVLPLFFIFTGLLGDVLSYVRLFALGVTSAVLGLVVNQIGMNMLSENWWSWIGVGAFLLFGHGLNFVLAALGSFIHPLRLTFVEFYNNAQFEGGGKTFQAFKKSKPLN